MPKEIKIELARVLEYMTVAEQTHYQEWFNDDVIQAKANKEEVHIYESVLALKSWLNEQN